MVATLQTLIASEHYSAIELEERLSADMNLIVVTTLVGNVHPFCMPIKEKLILEQQRHLLGVVEQMKIPKHCQHNDVCEGCSEANHFGEGGDRRPPFQLHCHAERGS